MRAKLQSHLYPARAALLAAALCYPALALAQEIDFQNSIDASAEALILLDVKASDCLNALDTSEDATALCNDFMSAIDGEVIAAYLEHCRTLKAWRDGFVDQTVEQDLQSDGGSDEEMLRRLVAIEYTCGENSLLQRTEFVATAFDRVQSQTGLGTAAIGASAASLSRQLSESRFNALERVERDRLQDAMQNQQRRSQRESERQFRDLENELLRQQINNASRPQN